MVSLIKSKQFRSIFFLLLKLGVLSLLIFFLHNRISALPDGLKIPSTTHYDFLILLIFLMPINIYIEWVKWNIILRDQTVGSQQKLHSFLSGIVSGVITPAYAGNFLGRMLYFPRSTRKNIIINTLASNSSQFIMSIFMGIFALQIIYFNSLDFIVHICLLIINLGLFLLFFYGDVLLEKFPSRYLKQISGVIISRKLRMQLLILSFLRYCVFVIQFLLALMVFGVNFDMHILLWIMLMFGAITVSPSVFMGKLIVRETVALSILTLIGLPASAILLAALSIWLLNQILPALTATLLVKKRNQHAWV